jgi:tetratricopeptide (TPR) repeat protein
MKGRMAAAALCLRANRLTETINELNSVYSRQPNNTLVLYCLGHCYERLGKEAEAVEFYQDCLKFKGYLRLPAQRLAAIYFKNGQLEKTVQQHEDLKEQYPDDIPTLVTLGYLYIATARYPKAIETFDAAILLHPDNFLAQDSSLDELLCSGQYQEVLDRLNAMLEQQPERPDLLAKQADVLSMLGDTADAISQYQQALRFCPDFLEATIKLGTQYLKIDAEQLAAQQFSKAAEINDRIVDAYVGLATAQRLDGRTTEANTAVLFAQTAYLMFKTALRSDLVPAAGKDGSDIINELIKAHQNHLKSNPYNPDLHYRLGLLLMSIDRLADAVECFRHALQANASHTRAFVKLCLCLFEIGNKTEAITMITTPQKLPPETVILHYKTALLYCDKLRFASSILNLQRRIEANMTLPTTTTCHISVVLQNLGLSDRAADMWDNLTTTAAFAPAAKPVQ